MNAFIAQAAKAVAALLVPVIVTLLASAIERLGIDVPIDPTEVETAVMSIVSAIVVYLTTNRAPEQ